MKINQNTKQKNEIQSEHSKRKQKPLKNLTLLDRFLFDTAIEKPEICHTILSIIFNKNIPEIRINTTEKTLESYYDTRSIRLDLLAFDIEDNVYNAEAQQRNTGYDILCRRSRFYQGQIDVNLLEPGEIDFSKLNNTYMIFISPFDLFGEKKFMYTFSMRCNENPQLLMNDGAVRIFLNTKGENYNEVSEELVEFLHYAEKSNLIGMNIKSERVKALSTQIESIKANHEVGVKYMQLWEEIEYYCADAKEEAIAAGRAEGFEIGRNEGLELGRNEGLEIGRNEGQILKLIDLIQKKMIKGMSPEEIADLFEEDIHLVHTIYNALKDMPISTAEGIYTKIIGSRQL